MNLINWLCNILGCTPNKPTVSIPLIEVSDSWMANALRVLPIKQRFPLGHRAYYVCTEQDFNKFVVWDWVDTLKYVRNKFDCNFFASLCQAHGALYYGLTNIGWVLDYGSGHSYNTVVYDTGKVDILEPQEDALYFWQDRPEKMYHLVNAYLFG